MKKTFRSALGIALFLALAIPSAFAATKVLDFDFESGKRPKGGITEKLTVAADKARAHSGSSSLRMTATTKGEWGNLVFDLGKPDFSANHEISVWVYAEGRTRFSAYISADDGSGDPYVLVHASGNIEPGKWSRLSGMIYAGEWRKNDRDFNLVVRTRGTCWIDDLQLVSGLPETPAQVWPKLQKIIHAEADKRVSTIARGATLTLDARNAVLAPDTGRMEVTAPAGATAAIPAEGVLVFAVDAQEDLDLAGSVRIEPDANLQPGLRVAVLSDDTVIAAPGVRGAPWKATPGKGNRPGPTPDMRGERPSPDFPLTGWRMTKGRHYITIAGPHMRAGGTFGKIEIRASARPLEKPLHSFAFFTDTHLGFGRITKAHSKINASTGEQLEATLRLLKNEGASYAIIGGDMTDGGRRSQYMDLARAIENGGLPVYGCIGNHDTFRDSRTKDIRETIPHLFPEGPDNTDYAFSRSPLRFIVLDGSYWTTKDGKISGHRIDGVTVRNTYRKEMLDWLRATLAKDTTTPTIIISHYGFYLRRGVSTATGYNLGEGPRMDKKLMAVLDAAPNVIATMNGHHHSNTVGVWHGITSLQNPAFATWPNGYRVFRVYPDRMEWEVRQMPNRGLVRESANPQMKLLTPLSFYDDDLGGTISLAPRKRAPAAKK